MIGGVAVVVVVLWLLTGIYIVNADEEGVVRLFGRHYAISNPGLSWRPPSPITSLVKVNVKQIRTAEIGFRTTETGLTTRELAEALMLTTDNSIVEAQLVIQYRVGDSRAFVYNVANPEQILHTTAEVALRSIVGRTGFVQSITQRAVVEQDTRAFLEELLGNYNTGIVLSEVKLQVMDPPDEVKDAFQEVTRALEDETRLENQAEAYRAEQLPGALGQVQVTVRSAAAFHQQQVERARGEANRFLALLQEYRGAPQVTRERLYLETLEDVLATVDKTLIDAQIDILPFLNVSGLGVDETPPLGLGVDESQ